MCIDVIIATMVKNVPKRGLPTPRGYRGTGQFAMFFGCFWSVVKFVSVL